MAGTDGGFDRGILPAGESGKAGDNRMHRIDTKLIRDKVAAELRQAILYGSFAANEKLSLDKIAADLGVSKMPIREAVQLLATEGLLTILPNRAPVVNIISDDFISDHFEIRSLLEQEGIARACKRGTDCQKLREFHRKAQEAIFSEDYAAFNDYNGRIHQAIWRLSGNLKLEQLLSQMWHTMHIDVSARENALNSNREHGEMIDCIERRDPDAARAIMNRHVTYSCEKIIRLKKARLAAVRSE
jgi:DNA-binding GntR family transcriptional regulator